MALYKNRAGRVIEGINPDMFPDHKTKIERGELTIVRETVEIKLERKEAKPKKDVGQKQGTQIEFLRDEYLKKFGKKVYFGWSEDQIREKLQEKE